MTAIDAPNRALLLGGVSLLIAWGAVGFYDNLRFGCSGGLYDSTYTVPQLGPESIGTKGGLRPGDRVVSVEGFPVRSIGMESRWPRALAARPGESRRFLVERNHGMELVNVVYEPAAPCLVHQWLAGAAVCLVFLGCGIWAVLTVGSPAADALAGTGFAAALFGSLSMGPNVGWWRALQCNGSAAAAALVPLFALWFFLTFPEEKRVGRSRVARWIAGSAFVCLLAFLVVEIAIHPVLYEKTGLVIIGWTIVCALLTLAAIVHTLVKMPRGGIRRSGMLLIFAGWLVVIAGVVLTMLPFLKVAGWVSLLLWAALPLSMAMAVKQRRDSLPEPFTRQ